MQSSARKITTSFFCFFAFFFLTTSLQAQNCSTLNLQLQSDIPSLCGEMSVTMIHDALNRPYLYVANKEAGLTIYDITDITNPVFLNDVPILLYDSLHVMNLYMDSIYLYMAVGNHFTNPQDAGMVIIDLTSPFFPVLLDFYKVPFSGGGAGVVRTEGNYAYLGAMTAGLVIFDITDKTDIQLVSQFLPDINYPVNNPNPDLYNARGMEVKDDIVYLCFDAGGMRIINCTNKLNPVETGRYANPALFQPFNLPRAYNNVILKDTLLFVTVDYCGVEVLNIADTSNISLTGWWNPYNCPGNNWFASPSHTNELQYDEDCALLFVSTGKSDAMVLDVSDPTTPDSCNYFGGVNNGIGTWGIARYNNEIYLSYICTLGIPFASNYTGVKILTYDPCLTGLQESYSPASFNVFPNPVGDELTIELNNTNSTQIFDVNIYDIQGRLLLHQTFTAGKELIKIKTGNLKAGAYQIELISKEYIGAKKMFLKN